jgi:putative spermidine/putrescine transport system permease protein
VIFILGILYFFVPLISTFEFSLRAIRGRYSFEAYRLAFADPEFYLNFGYSLLWAVVTIVVSLLLIVPTAYWVHLRLPRLRPAVEFVTLMPFVVPAVVLIFGMIRLYGSPPITLTSTPILLVAGYIVLSLPYMFRAVDTGLRAIDVRTLTEAAQSLGAYMEEIGAMRAYTPQALSVVSFLLTWASIGLLQWVGRGAPGQTQVAGAR